jgi:hypothetical protein
MTFSRSVLIAWAIFLSSACGGGSDSTATPTAPAASTGVASTPANNGSVPTGATPDTSTPGSLPVTFAAQLIEGPANNTFLGFEPYLNAATFVVAGAGMENVELVSANDDGIVYGRFTVAPDKTGATLDWRYRNWPYGSWNLKIVAWDVPAGQTGRRIDVATRQYTVHLPLGCQAEGTCGMPAP